MLISREDFVSVFSFYTSHKFKWLKLLSNVYSLKFIQNCQTRLSLYVHRADILLNNHNLRLLYHILNLLLGWHHHWLTVHLLLRRISLRLHHHLGLLTHLAGRILVLEKWFLHCK